MGIKWKIVSKIGLFVVLISTFCIMTSGLVNVIQYGSVLFRSSLEPSDNHLRNAVHVLSELLIWQSEEAIMENEKLSANEKNDEIARFRSHWGEMNAFSEHILYFAQRDDIVFSNIEEFPEDEPFEMYLSYQNGRTSATFPISHPTLDAKIFVGYDNAYVAQLQDEFLQAKAIAKEGLDHAIIMFIVCLAALLGLIWIASGSLWMDKMWNEATALLITIPVGFYITMILSSYNFHLFSEFPMLLHLISTLLLLIGTGLLLILVRNFKNGRLFKGTFIYAMCKWGCNVFLEINRSKPITHRISAVIAIGMCIGLITQHFFPFFVATVAGVIWVVLKYVIRPYDEELSDRLSHEVDEKMKSERLKTELITNVSHDLKTPLTAILNYSDLLLKKDPENEYAQIINQKGHKLRALTEDLFTVSKAQSGNIDANMETLDLAELIDQVLAEHDGHDVHFKVNLQERAFVADGTLMARVFGNLVGNIVKYSLSGTRAYIDSYMEEDKIMISFKNIANYEMNFDASEIAERFKRGDDARSTEGNGLGLAIAKSYVEACGGQLKVEVDGDLFKTMILLT